MKALAYLREEKIDAIEFSNYLYEEFQIILINEKSNRTNIKEFLENEKKDIYLLLVGYKAQNFYANIQQSNLKKSIIVNSKIKGVINFLHPSGYNLNSNSTLLYKNWYELKGATFNEDKYIQKFKLLLP